VLFGVPEVQALAGILEAVLEYVPDPDRAVGQDQDVLGLAQTSFQGLAIELAQQILDPRRVAT
jgi:hypothetical protein